MSTYEQALISAARPQLLAARANACFRKEISKGCQADLAPAPVAL